MKFKMAPGEEKALVAFVAAHPELYDKGHSQYKNMIRKDQLWKEIAEELKKDSMYIIKISSKDKLFPRTKIKCFSFLYCSFCG